MGSIIIGEPSFAANSREFVIVRIRANSAGVADSLPTIFFANYSENLVNTGERRRSSNAGDRPSSRKFPRSLPQTVEQFAKKED
jgi:hypothetical protein